MNFFNHYAYGAVGEWLYGTVAGISTSLDEPGYKHVILRPQRGGRITFAKATYDSIHGTISAHWRITNGRLAIDVFIPVNTRATMYLPVASEDAVSESGKPVGEANSVSFLKCDNGCAVFAVGSGQYTFEMPYPSK